MSDYGVHNTRWLLMHALRGAPIEHLHEGIANMLYYMEKAENPDVHRAWDILAQVTFTGGYIFTGEETTKVFDIADPDEYDEGKNPRNPGTPITEDEIQSSVRWWDNLLGNAEDPFDTKEEK